MEPIDVEVAVVGGGPAGLSAALVLGRSRRTTVLFDAGEPRNAPAAAAHNVFTRDGTPPHELNRIGREQLAPYPSVQLRRTRVDDVERREDGRFELRDAEGSRAVASHLVFATGLVDELPPVEGLRELWGSGVFHCPYCHGWEVRDRPFVLLAQSSQAMHFARVLRGWSTELTVCPVEGFTVEPEERRDLEALGVRFRDSVSAVVGGPDGSVEDVVLSTGERLGAAAVFTSAPVAQRSGLPAKLGCTVVAAGEPGAGQVKVDQHGFSGVPGIYVVGDAAVGFTQVASAAHAGNVAAAMLNNQLLFAGELPRGARER